MGASSHYGVEPLHAVTHNGVEFKVNDIKALVSLHYSGDLDVKFMSLRCDQSGSGENPWVWSTRITEDDACSDTNPGAFHVAISNLIGIEKESRWR